MVADCVATGQDPFDQTRIAQVLVCWTSEGLNHATVFVRVDGSRSVVSKIRVISRSCSRGEKRSWTGRTKQRSSSGDQTTGVMISVSARIEKGASSWWSLATESDRRKAARTRLAFLVRRVRKNIGSFSATTPPRPPEVGSGWIFACRPFDFN